MDKTRTKKQQKWQLVEFLEADLIRNTTTNQDGNQQSTIESKTMDENSHDDAIVVDEDSVGGVHDE